MIIGLKKGFTLIELLVVIAIIAVLSSVVLASLGTARDRGADTAVKQNLRNIRIKADMIYDENQTKVPPEGYNTGGSASSGICNDSKVIEGRTAAANAVGGVYSSVKCAHALTGWAVKAPLSGGVNYWCIDHNGTPATYTIPGGGIVSSPVCP